MKSVVVKIFGGHHWCYLGKEMLEHLHKENTPQRELLGHGTYLPYQDRIEKHEAIGKTFPEWFMDDLAVISAQTPEHGEWSLTFAYDGYYEEMAKLYGKGGWPTYHWFTSQTPKRAKGEEKQKFRQEREPFLEVVEHKLPPTDEWRLFLEFEWTVYHSGSDMDSSGMARMPLTYLPHSGKPVSELFPAVEAYTAQEYAAFVKGVAEQNEEKRREIALASQRQTQKRTLASEGAKLIENYTPAQRAAILAALQSQGQQK